MLVIYNFEGENHEIFTVPCRVQLQLHNGILQHAVFHRLGSRSHPSSRTGCYFLHTRVGQNRAWLEV